MVGPRQMEAVLELWDKARETTVHTLTGNCMHPVLCDGDRVVVLHGSHDLRFGDVVVVHTDDRYLVQRVVRIRRGDDGPRYTVRGDRYSPVYRDLAPAQVVGKVGGLRRGERIQSMDSFPWRPLGFLLAVRSHLACRREDRAPWWRLVRALHALRLRVLPPQWSITLLPFTAFCGIHRALQAIPRGRQRN